MVHLRLPSFQDPFGHAGITLVDSGGNQNRYDFGSALSFKSSSEYGKTTSAFNKVAHIAGMSAYALFQASTMFLGAAIATGGDASISSAMGVLGVLYGIISYPMTGTVLKNSPKTCSSYTEYEIKISQQQFHQAKKSLEESTHRSYTITTFNCVGFTKEILRKSGINIPRSILNTPRRLARTLAKNPSTKLMTRHGSSPEVFTCL